MRLGEVGSAQRAVQWVGWMWVAFAVVETVIGLNFALSKGQHALTVVTAASSLLLLALGWVIAFLGHAQIHRPAEGVPTSAASPPANTLHAPHPDDKGAIDSDTEAHKTVLAVFERLMNEQRLFLDVNLTLDRVARRAGIPARQISVAVNAVHGRNVSQVVNEYRVAEAQRLLACTSHSVLEILLDAGFQTKSNFNREFLRVVGMSPTEYRARAAQTPTV